MRGLRGKRPMRCVGAIARRLVNSGGRGARGQSEGAIPFKVAVSRVLEGACHSDGAIREPRTGDKGLREGA